MSDKVGFSVRCPNGHMPSQVFERSLLERRLVSGQPIRLSCITCDLHWDAGANEREGISQVLDRADG